MEVTITENEKQTIKWAKKFIKNKTNEVICLKGKMGSGKTVIVRGFAKAFKIKELVTSPTFNLVHHYEGKTSVYHFDLYRLSSEDELLNTGFYEYIQKPGIKVFEWPKDFNIFPENRYDIEIEILDYEKRKITARKVL
jgi:tRNA threonylcarbamoyladenosine biosynthesis protein TsaE